MQFSLIDTTNKNLFIFPVAPSSMTLLSQHKEIEINSITLGDIPWGRGRSPDVITLEGKWLGYKQNVERNHYLEPAKIDELFRDVFQHRPFAKELRFIITDEATKTDINMPVYLQSYSTELSGGDGTLTYTMTLKEYRSYRIRRFPTSSGVKSGAKEGKRPTPPKPQTYTVKSGDNLWAITRKYLGNGARYMELYNLNKGTLKGKSPNLIYPGEKLKIPAGWVK